MSAWTTYVKLNYHKVSHLPNKERLKALSEMRKKENGHAGAATPKRTKPKRAARAKGGDLMMDFAKKTKDVLEDTLGSLPGMDLLKMI